MNRCDVMSCKRGRQVSQKDDIGYVMEELCIEHAKEVISDRVEALRRFVFDATSKSIAKIIVEWLPP